ncbi:hypothetical protein [uncultured Microbacterium sp.]|uniref:hypothetical protein n=1 Tax=uncultured Microbacterium sp. TaxID=191216 RepID=UPI0025E2873F|nr:hypothetical protein [uncultured Microbacterium sp.]
MTSALLTSVPPHGAAGPAPRPSTAPDPAGQAFADSLREALAGSAVTDDAEGDAGSPTTERRCASSADDGPPTAGAEPAPGGADACPGRAEPVLTAAAVAPIATGDASVAETSAVPLPGSAIGRAWSDAGAPPVGDSAGTVAAPGADPAAAASTAAPDAPDAARRADTPTPAAASVPTPPAASVPTPPAAASAPVPPGSADAPIAPSPRSIVAQVTPPMRRLAQLSEGTHRLTLVVTPEAVGPVTVRAHIGAGGDVRIELLTATDLARDALRGLLGELRRDLAGIAPGAHVAIGEGTASDSPPRDAGAQQSPRGLSGDRDAPARRLPPRDLATPSAPTPRAVLGGGLDILA